LAELFRRPPVDESTLVSGTITLPVANA